MNVMQKSLSCASSRMGTLLLLVPALIVPVLSLTGCDDSDTETAVTAERFELQFSAKMMDMDINCDTAIPGMGPDGDYTVGVGDLRFYVSDLKFHTSDGEVIETTLDDNDFQLNHPAGTVALIDFLPKSSSLSTADTASMDFCSAVEEGTPRVNTQITGEYRSDSTITGVSFAVGVPPSLMKAAIANTDNVNDAPSPLNEMHWSWAAGYRHFVANFTAMDAAHTSLVNNSNIHVGSRGCKLESSAKALEEKDQCDLPYIAKVMLDAFDPAVNRVVVDVTPLINAATAADFLVEKWATFEDESQCLDDRRNGDTCVLDQQFGAQCHSTMRQSACASFFPVLGLDLLAGTATASLNHVFQQE